MRCSTAETQVEVDLSQPLNLKLTEEPAMVVLWVVDVGDPLRDHAPIYRTFGSLSMVTQKGQPNFEDGFTASLGSVFD